ncbi:hypothetical protein BGW80DRAFT_1305317 [Lactifluus volemus]|nr:hypothetical protein BGW80DRAFT_1305317 [Lactifluus volemus]
MRTVKMRKTLNTTIGPKGTGLLDILLRDGALYFAVLGLTVLTNILAIYFLRPTLKNIFIHPVNCISVTLCSRLVLNLYEAATPDNSISSSSPDPATTCVLTTRIELGRAISQEQILHLSN